MERVKLYSLGVFFSTLSNRRSLLILLNNNNNYNYNTNNNKLLHLLRTSNCYNRPLLLQFDSILKSGLSIILNVDFDETQWIQATLPDNDEGLGIDVQQRARGQHPHFCPLLLQMHIIQQAIYHHHTTKCHTKIGFHSRRYGARFHLPTHLINKYSAFKSHGIHRLWMLSQAIYASATSDDRARLIAACAPHSGWFISGPTNSIGRASIVGCQWSWKKTNSYFEHHRFETVR